jgi:hypothetical protein
MGTSFVVQVVVYRAKEGQAYARVKVLSMRKLSRCRAPLFTPVGGHHCHGNVHTSCAMVDQRTRSRYDRIMEFVVAVVLSVSSLSDMSGRRWKFER